MFQAVEGTKWSQWDLLKLNSFSFGITGFILAMDTVVLPVFVLTVAPDELKNTYLAILGISGLVMAAFVQPTIGRIRTVQVPTGPSCPFYYLGFSFRGIGVNRHSARPIFGGSPSGLDFIKTQREYRIRSWSSADSRLYSIGPYRHGVICKNLSRRGRSCCDDSSHWALIGEKSGSLNWEWISLGILPSSCLWHFHHFRPGPRT
ncbi:MAG: hypothetical protein CM1200mP22_30840 [Dehalococcoidia bacterium]|nr:MAG: hypothetical protein CM1200mP22_30840 [Dehalococcoidia bacterium]